jgi:phospholipid/cholesterol/gamma-HCH transport system substrate-binding protein
MGKGGGAVAAIVALALLAAGVALYILAHQRVRFPWEAESYRMHVEVSSAQAVVPGQGQTVRVAGVRIGAVDGARLVDGLAVVDLSVDPEYRHMIRTDASAQLRPRTALKDMFVELDPGSRRAPEAPENFTIPVARTSPDVNLDQINSELDADTRDYLQLLISGAARGLRGRGGDLRDVLRRFEPTQRDLARIATSVAAERHALRRLVTSLQRVNGTLAGRSGELTRLVDASARVFGAFARQDRNLSEAVRRLPGALGATTRALGEVRPYADLLGPTARRLVPVARAVVPANAALRPFARATAPVVRTELRPFARAARPAVRRLGPAAARVADATPDLTRLGTALNHLLNMAAFDPAAGKAPDDRSRIPGYLFWIAWGGHIGTNLWSTADANGPVRPVLLGFNCATAQDVANRIPGASTLYNLPAVRSLACGEGGGGG